MTFHTLSILAHGAVAAAPTMLVETVGRLGKGMARTLGVLGVLLASHAMAEPYYTGSVGDDVGKGFDLTCGTDVMVGLYIRQGDGLDNVKLICAVPRKGGYLDPPYRAKGSAGGGGGRGKAVACPGNSAVEGLSIGIISGTGGQEVVNDVSLYCFDVETGSTTRVGTNADFGGYLPFYDEVTCGSGDIGYGIHGRADNMVFMLGLTCEDDPFIVAAQQGGGGGGGGEPAPQAGGNEWSAFAASDGGDWGYGVHKADEQTASKLALEGCGGAGAGCKVFWTTRDQCVSFAESRDGGYWYAAGGGTSESEAQASAVRFCQSGSAPGNTCAATVTECR